MEDETMETELKAITLFNLPPLPPCKSYVNERETPEKQVIFKCMNSKYALTTEDRDILQQAIDHYKIAFPALKLIDLPALNTENATHLKQYMDRLLNFNFLIANDINFDRIFRAAVIKEDWRKDGRIRNSAYLTYPKQELINKWNLYNRCSTSAQTVFYGAFHASVALWEIKPKVGDRVLLTAWDNDNRQIFRSYPLMNADVNSRLVRRTNEAFQNSIANAHGLFKELINQITKFFASEIVKQVEIRHPNRLEYFFSSYISDRILFSRVPSQPDWHYDLILYPSVAANYATENVAMHPYSFDSRMKCARADEVEILETYFDQPFDYKKMPVKMNRIRTVKLVSNYEVFWDDEKLD